MPFLLLLRHAKAERAGPGESDHERILADRGRQDCATMGQIMAQRFQADPAEAPDLVLCSSSQRTRETWELVRSALKAPPAPRFSRSIFEAGDYLPILQREGGAARSLLLVGHNPIIMDAATRIVGPESATFGGRFPTAALAVIAFDGGWDKLQPSMGRLLAFVAPRDSDSD